MKRGMMKAVMLAALGAVATGAFCEVVETNRINVANRSSNDIRMFGAREGGTPRENAAAIQRAIDAAAENCGRVVVPAGTFVSGTLWLKSGVTLHLDKGAVLKASDDLADYNAEDAYPENFGCPKSEYWRGLHFIICRGQKDVAIEGEGTIDGNGDAFFEEKPKAYFPWMKSGSAAWWNGIRWAKDKEKLRPGQLVVFVKCEDVTVKGITIHNSPCWSLFFHGCRNVTVRDYTVRNGPDDGNTDGVDLDCVSNATLENLDIDTGDDAIAIRAVPRRLQLPEPPPCENITIRNAKLRSTSSVFRLGVGDGLIRNVTVENVVSDRGGTAIMMDTLYGEPESGGVDMENIVFRNCRFDNCRFAYSIWTAGRRLEFGVRDVTFENCTFPKGVPRRVGGDANCRFRPVWIRTGEASSNAPQE